MTSDTPEGHDFESVLQGYMPKTVNMSGTPEWGEPSVEGQFEDQKLWEQDSWSVRVFDLAKAKDIKEYEELLTASGKKDPKVVILEQDKQYCESTANWKIFVTTVSIIYKKLVKEKSHE
jgi:hypothetical protein